MSAMRSGSIGDRPRIHITAPRGWLNDPNGPIHHDGRYHVYFQYNPAAPVWGRPSWGHVSSPDLVEWTDHPVALRPRPDGPDRDGCWSGCIRIIEGRPTAYYTGVIEADGQRIESICVAHGSADLERWQAQVEPLVAGPPPGIGRDHRDPFVFGAPGAWRMLIGAGLHRDGTASGAILQYTSPDARAWTYRGVLWQRPVHTGPIDTGRIWECPQLVRSGGSDALIYSVLMEGEDDPLRYAVVEVGALGTEAFVPRTIGRVDHGRDLYAPAVTVDARGRTLLWGWIQDRHGSVDVDHNGALSLPRVVDIVDDRLRVMPVPELRALRRDTAALGQVRAAAMLDLTATPRLAGCFELTAVVPAGAAGRIELIAGEIVSYQVDLDAGRGIARIVVAGAAPFEVPLAPRDPRQDRVIRLFVDASIMELFLDDEVAVTSRCYAAEASALRVTSLAPDVPLRDLEVHALRGIFPGRGR
jgi:beta-fructofuranosidase